MTHRFSLFLPLFLLALLISGFFAPCTYAYNEKLCRATVDCPPNYDGDTVTVGYDVAILSEMFEHCAPDSIKEGVVDTITDTISLFVIIDHSSSMSIMDPESKRYNITCAMIDTIFNRSPKSEIGIAVFSNKLMHNAVTDSFFNTLDSSQAHGWNDAYVPLTRLDSQVGGVSAVEKLKWAIALSDTATDPGNNKKLENGYYETSGRVAYNGGTDISIAFEAAKEAFKSALYARKRQFIVFISDGIHQLIDTERQSHAGDYLAGDSVPTTYTAFFVNQGQPIPDQIDSMTTNIQNNGYSENNYSTTVWSTQAQEQKFFSLLLNNVIGDGLKHFFSTPVSMIINGDSATTFDDTFAYFETPLVPLNAHSPTTMNVNYTWHWLAPINKDETRNYSVTIKHTNVGIPDLESVDCWNRGKIKYYYNTNEIISAGPTHTLVEVRFFPPDSGNFPPLTGSTVALTLTNNNATDTLPLTLSKDITGTYYSATFSRQYASPNPSDGILQNSNTDSIRAIYRNPAIPLDTLRKVIGVLPYLDLSVKKVYYLDKNANGYPDTVRFEQGGGRVLSAEDCAVIKPYIAFVTPRQITAVTLAPVTQGFDIGVNEETGTTPNTGLYSDERVNIICNNVTLPSGTQFPYTDTTIADSMAPVIVRADYYDLADTLKTDTLKVVFSEDVRTIANTEPFKFNRDTIPEYKLRLTYIRTDSNVVVFTVFKLAGQVSPQKGDSIWINETASISDPIYNYQTNPGNIRRLLNYYQVISIESATYIDNSPVKDGLIDMITVKTDAVPDQALRTALLNTITLPDYRSFTVSGINAAADGFAIMASEPHSYFPNTRTDPLQDSLTVTLTSSTTNSIILAAQTVINDGVAPVINRAVLTPKSANEGSTTNYDSLEISFSEPVKAPPFAINKPFLFRYGSPVQTYTMELQPLSSDSAGKVQTFQVLSSEKEFPETGDSVWIDTAALVADFAGNVQNKDNRPAPLEVKQRNFIIDVIVTPNPGDFYQIINIDNISDKGILIKVDIIDGYSPHLTMEALLTIFDAVGNTVLKINGIPSTDKKSFYFVWQGFNKNDRKVGEGTYLGNVVVKRGDGQERSERVYIGIKMDLEKPW